MSDVQAQVKSATPTREQRIAAYWASLTHHGNIIQSFSSSFVNIFAVFNAGAFAATVAVLPTDIGKQALKAYPNLSLIILILFAVGFFCSTGLMAVIFQYSLKKYRSYRNILRAPSFNALVDEPIKFYVSAWMLLTITIGATVVAVFLSLFVLYHVAD